VVSAFRRTGACYGEGRSRVTNELTKDTKTNPGVVQHLELAHHAFSAMQQGSYKALAVNDLDTLRAGLGECHEAIAAIAKR
jgi:hypothetical protein